MARRAVSCYEVIWDGPKTDQIDKSNSETQLAVLVNGHLNEWFQMRVGNRQGDPLSQRSFALFLERIMIKSRIEKTME